MMRADENKIESTSEGAPKDPGDSCPREDIIEDPVRDKCATPIDNRQPSAMKRRRDEDEREQLCCCEYINRHGQRSHVGACCCDCEDLDEACDRFFKREPQSPEAMSRVVTEISDRVRVPWFRGGARRVDLSVIPPLVLLPTLLHLSAFHFLVGLAVLITLPGLLLWYYYFTHRKKARTLFFLSLVLFSLGYMYYLFITKVVPRGGLGAVHVGTVTVGVLLTLLGLAITKRGPGVVKPKESNPVLRDQVGESQEAEPSRKNWCSVCRLVRPPRAGHCRICGLCVLRHDHHCVWIDSCVGRENHRSFLLTLVLFLFTSSYGIGLTLQSVCPEQIILTALFYCPGVYEEYSASLCFTCAWYCTLVTCGVFHLLLTQLLNISYNVTEREARAAVRERSARRALCGLAVDTGVHSRGLCANWAEFWTMSEERTSCHPGSEGDESRVKVSHFNTHPAFGVSSRPDDV
ncbi:palmitoyltransferase ZDHHC23-B isoform X1 [Syngnathus scovelli]|uniref:palmitoyltransferase ZDHHC23-B isoform X1 n=2 Tax=Syngnathus scovelli TaxID=161590 RepID=UPI00210FE9EA|nr:palmitoyltransferase ZDHHC23-B isoform X1 [Syngnathus scovelli]XP_049604759.1 palmitoyltransferase ZDHHC23-B isoform X1 [Syngnathus scovelli]